MIHLLDIFLILVTITSGFLKVWQKQISRYFEADSFTYLIQLVSVIFLIPICIFFINFNISFSAFNLLLILSAGISWYLGSLITNRAVKSSDLTLREPITQTRTIFVLIFSYFLLKEEVTTQILIGSLLIFLGSFISSYRSDLKLRSSESGAILLCFSAAFFTGVAYTFDKFALNFIEVIPWIFFTYSISLILSLPKTKMVIRDLENKSKRNVISLITVILLNSIAYASLIYIISKTDLSKTFPISQLSSVVIFISGVYLGERENIMHRSVGAVVCILGGIIIFL